MKLLFLSLIVSVIGCAANPPAAPVAEAAKPIEAPKTVTVYGADEKGAQQKLGVITIASGAVELEKDVKIEQIVQIMLQSYQTQATYFDKRYNELADLCIGRGKKVPTKEAPAKAKK